MRHRLAIDHQQAARREAAVVVALEEAAVDGKHVGRRFEEIGDAVSGFDTLLDRAEAEPRGVEDEDVDFEPVVGKAYRLVIEAGENLGGRRRLAALKDEREVGLGLDLGRRLRTRWQRRGHNGDQRREKRDPAVGTE